MYETTPNVYRQLAMALLEQIGTKEFFSGVTTICDNDIEHRLCCTLIIGRTKTPQRSIESIAPVWWSLTTIQGNEELINDFSFEELKHYIFD